MKKYRTQILILLLLASLFFNLDYALFRWNMPTYKVGILTKDVEIKSDFIETEEGKTIVVPRGFVVENESPEGFLRVGQFKPERFSVTITSDDPSLVDYSSKYAKKRKHAMYSAKSSARSNSSGNKCSPS